MDNGFAIDAKYVRATNFTGRFPYSVNVAASTSPNSEKICIVSQCSVDRLERLEKLGKLWNGAISVAVLIRSDNDASAFERLVQNWGDRKAWWNLVAARPSGQTLSNALPLYDRTYPYNTLRNFALSKSTSPYVFLIDIDFMPSRGLYAALQGSLPLSEGKSLVVAAFKTHGKVPRDMEELRNAMRAGNATTFQDGYINHRATNTSRFMTETSPYEVQYELDYEPYVVARRVSAQFPLPRYDERFRGYSHDKQEQIFHMAMRGFRFVVLPNQFLAHEEHPASQDKQWRDAGKFSDFMTSYLWDEFRTEVASEVRASGKPLPEWVGSPPPAWAMALEP